MAVKLSLPLVVGLVAIILVAVVIVSVVRRGRPVRPKSRILPPGGNGGLKGLVGVIVKCHVASEASVLAITEQELRGLVERKLRRAGIKVVNADSPEGPNGGRSGMLFVSAVTTTLRDPTFPVVYIVRCDVSRLVALNPYAEDEIDFIFGRVWEPPPIYGFGGALALRDPMRRDLDQVVDAFIDDFHAANRK